MVRGCYAGTVLYVALQLALHQCKSTFEWKSVPRHDHSSHLYSWVVSSTLHSVRLLPDKIMHAAKILFFLLLMKRSEARSKADSIKSLPSLVDDYNVWRRIVLGSVESNSVCRLLLHKNAGNEYGLEFNVAPHAFSLLVVYSEAEEVFCAPDSWGAMFECICTISFGCLLLIIYHDWVVSDSQ